MKKFLIVLVCLLGIGVLTSCVSNEKLLEGKWVAEQTSQQIGAADLSISHYNFWEINKDTIKLSNFVLGVKNGKTTKVFTNNHAAFHYSWVGNNQVKINNHIYQVDLKGNQLELWNDQIRTSFTKSN